MCVRSARFLFLSVLITALSGCQLAGLQVSVSEPEQPQTTAISHLSQTPIRTLEEFLPSPSKNSSQARLLNRH